MKIAKRVIKLKNKDNSSDQDQADNLRRRMSDNGLSSEEETDTFKLPPRSNIHQQNNKKIKFRIKYPLIRLMVAIFILLVVLIPGISIWQERTITVEKEDVQISSESVQNLEVEVERAELKVQPVYVPIEKADSSESRAVAEKPKEEKVEEIKDTINKEDNQVEAQSETQVEAQEFIIHIVKKDETLYRVSMKYYQSRKGEEIIKKFNDLKPNGVIYEGQKLKIPKR